MENKLFEYVLGIDIGGTNTVYSIVNTSGSIEYYNNVSTQKFDDPQNLLEHIKKNIGINAPEYDYMAVGIGAPNGSSKSGCIENAPNLRWKGIFHLKEMAQKIFEKPTAITNDANAAGLGECAWGKCRGMNDIIMLTIGTGLGCSIISNGQLVEGANGFAGEFGHITIQTNGRKCKCGKKGCLEQYISAGGILKTYEEISGKKLKSVKEIFEIYDKDQHAEKCIKESSELLGLHLANLINILNPQAVCIAGGIADSGHILLPHLKKSIDRNILPMFKNDLQVFFSKLENQTAGVLGAAYLAFDFILKNEDLY